VPHVLAQLQEVLRHQRDALACLDEALSEVERQLTAQDAAALRAALVAARAAADRAAALELTRELALVAVGAPPDLSIEDLGQALLARGSPTAAHLAADLRVAVDQVNAHRRRILDVLGSTHGTVPAVDLGRPLRA
jgi:hypothetical protein